MKSKRNKIRVKVQFLCVHHLNWSAKLIRFLFFIFSCVKKSQDQKQSTAQGLVKGAILCFRNLYFFQHGESTSTASQLNSPANQKSKDLNKVPLLLQDLGKMGLA